MASFWRDYFFNSTKGPRISEGEQTPGPSSRNSLAAVPINFDTAMQTSAFWAAARLTAETVGNMPLKAFKIDENGSKTIVTDNKVWRVLNFQPNQYQTRNEFFETLMLNLCVTGNFYGLIQKDSDGDLVGILPLMSSQMDPILMDDGSIVYKYINANGDSIAYSSQRIWHIKLFGNGIIGMSPLEYSCNAIGIASATDKRTTAIARNGFKSTGVLMVDKMLTTEQRNKLKENFKEMRTLENDQLYVLEADMKYQTVSLTPKDAQLLETRKYQVEEIARFMGVPGVLINDTDASTVWGSGIEQIVRGWYKLNIRPYLEKIESSISRHLLPIEDYGTFEIEFDFDSLTRADQTTRYASYNTGINAGFLTPNEARQREGLEDKEGGDQLLANGNLTPLDEVGSDENN